MKNSNPTKILIINTVFIVLLIATLGFVTYRYIDLDRNFAKRADKMVEKAVTENTEYLNRKFSESEKSPYKKFVAPEDLGRLSFDYPKTWSVYIAQDKVRGTYSAYFNPKKIRPITSDSRYALRLVIKNQSYERFKSQYDSKVKKGDLKLEVVKINDYNGILLKGRFSNVIEGSAVIFKLRDKAVMISTDAKQFEPDFYDLIKSIEYNI